MQTLTQLLMSMNQVLNQQTQKLDQQAQTQARQAQTQAQQARIQAQQAQALEQKLDQQSQTQAQQAQAMNMKLDKQFSRLEQDISQLSQQTGREIRRLDEEIIALNQKTEDLTQKTEGLNQKTEGLNQKTEDLNQKTEDLNQKTEDLNQRTEGLCREVEALLRPSATDQRRQLSVAAEPFVPAPQERTEPAVQDRQLSLPRHHQKIPRFDGKAPWEAYLAQFHIMANVNGWGDSEKAYYLSTSIEDPALSMLANLSAEDMMDFPKLFAALENRFGAKHQQQQSRVLLNTMKRQKSEPLQELVENIERRVRLAYPEATGDVQEALTMHHLTSAVDERMQAKLLRRKPRRLQDALEVLTTEEAIRDYNRCQHTASVREVNAREEEAQQQHTTSDDAFTAAVMRLTEAIQSQQVKPRADQADFPRRTSFTR